MPDHINTDKLYAIILAAGQGRRFGSAKQVAMFGNRSFVSRAIDGAAMLIARPHILIITGAHRQQVETEIAGAGVTIVHNRHWQAGIGTSIACGISKLPGDAHAALLMPCDQVLMGGEQLDTLKAAWLHNPSSIVASGYTDTVGIPAILPAEFFPALRKLPAASGAKALLQRHKKRVVCVDMPQAQYDIDSKQDMITAGLPTAEDEVDSNDNSHD